MTVVLATFLVSLSTSTLGVAVPRLTRSLHANPLGSSFVVITPALVSTSLMLVLGRVGDLVGRRRGYLFGLSSFTVGSFALALAPTVWVFIGLQACAAVGVASVWANSAAIIFETSAPEEFHRGLGYYIAAVSLGELAGPSIGGVIVETLGWHWIFWINAVGGLACLVWGWRELASDRSASEHGTIDVLGAIALAVAIGSMTVSLLFAESGEVSASGILWGAAAAVASFGLFALAEHRAKVPLIDVVMFRQRAFSLALISGLLIAMSQWVPTLLMVLFFQAVKGTSPALAGLMVMPLPIVSTLVSASAGRLSRYQAPRRLAVIGCTLSATGLAVIGMTLRASYFELALGFVIAAIGGGIASPAIANSMLTGAPPANAGQVNGTRLTAQNLGWVGSTALALLIITSPLKAHDRYRFFNGTASRVSKHMALALVHGYQETFVILTGLAVLAALVGALSARAALARAS